MKLSDVQRAFGEAIRSPQAVTDANASFVAVGSRTPATQLETYREQFWLRHVGCMVEDFPALQAVVGEEAFAKLCERYFAAHPPSSYLLRDLGAQFAAFLEREKEPRFVSDLARLEWAFIDAFDAADASPLDPASITTIAEDEWPRAVLALHPSLQLLELEYPAERVRSTFRLEAKVLRPDPEPTAIAVYRRDLLLYAEPLERAAVALLARLQKGEALGAASEAVAAKHPDVALDQKLGEWFARWTALGWVSAVRVGA